MRLSNRLGKSPWGQSIARAILIACIAIPMAACGSNSTKSVFGNGLNDRPRTQEEWRSAAETWGKRYSADNGNKSAALNYASALRALDQKDQAVAVLQVAAIKAPKDMTVLAAYGKALLDVGRAAEAAEVLSRAHSPDQPDWRILKAQGTAADLLGDSATAQRYYEAALKLAPGEPTILTNLGLSYALSKKLKEAEQVLREAAAHPKADQRVKDNLAFVLSLSGKTNEANAVSQHNQKPVAR